MKPILLDTGVIVALLNSADSHHKRCDRATAELDHPLVTCEAVIMESCYLLRKFPAAVNAVLKNVEIGIFEIPFQLSRSVASIRAIQAKYVDLPVSLADACLVQLADELDTGQILTLDKHFLHYRWRRTKPFDLLIAPA